MDMERYLFLVKTLCSNDQLHQQSQILWFLAQQLVSLYGSEHVFGIHALAEARELTRLADSLPVE